MEIQAKFCVLFVRIDTKPFLSQTKASINSKSWTSPSTKNYSCDYQPDMMKYDQY